MGGIKTKYENASQALTSFKSSVDLFKEFISKKPIQPIGSLSHEKLLEAMRDSMIQRFEYTLEAFWKFLKAFLEREKIFIEFVSPKQIITAACKASYLKEEEGQQLLEMVDSRNMTSHIYKQEIAERLAVIIPTYCQIFEKILLRLKN